MEGRCENCCCQDGLPRDLVNALLQFEEEEATVTFPMLTEVLHPTASNQKATRLDVVNVTMTKHALCKTFLKEHW